MDLKVFGLHKCSTCQKALAWLDESKIAYTFVDVKDAPLDPARVANWSAAVGGWEKLINRAGYTWRGLAPVDTDNLNEARAVDLAVRNPSLIRRPLIEHGDGSASAGFSEKIRAKLKP